MAMYKVHRGISPEILNAADQYNLRDRSQFFIPNVKKSLKYLGPKI